MTRKSQSHEVLGKRVSRGPHRYMDFREQHPGLRGREKAIESGQNERGVSEPKTKLER